MIKAPSSIAGLSNINGDMNFSFTTSPKSRFRARILGLSLLILLGLSARAETPQNLNEASKTSKNWFCELALVKRSALVLKGLRDRVSWGRPGMSEIRSGDFDSYLKRIDQSHTNRGQVIPSVYGPIQGFDPDRSARIQQMSADNRNSITPSYFKSFEPEAKRTFETLESIWYRARNQEPNADWKESMSRIEEWLKSYTEYQDILNTTIIEGFEARLQAEVLLNLLQGKSAQDFQSDEIIRDGVKIDLPTLTWDAASHQAIKGVRKVSFRTYPELTSSYMEAVKEFGETFGLPSNPAQLIEARRASLKKIPWTQMLNPLFWIFSLPYRMINDVVGVSVDSFTWLKSKLIAMGQIQGVVDAQAYRRRRLELAHKVITNRRDFQGFPLIAEEEVLLKKLEAGLLDPALAPRSDAVRREQAMEMRAEAWAFYGKRSSLAKFGNSNSTGGSLIPGNSGAIVPVVAPSSVNKDRGLPELESNEQLSYVARVKQMFDRHKKLLALGAVTTSLTGVILLQLNNVVAPITENPSINYGQAMISDHVNLMVAKYFDTDGSGNSVIRKQVKISGKVWDIENPAIYAIIDSHLSRYREKYRMDPDYNFLADPAFQKDQAQVIDKLLQVRRNYGVSALFASGSEYLLKVAYQKAAIEEMREAFKVQYPTEHARIDVAFNIVAANKYQSIANLDLVAIKSSAPELYLDLRYFFEKKLPEAAQQVKIYGVMFTVKGDAYQSFGRAPKEFKDQVRADDTKAAEEALKAQQKIEAAKELEARKISEALKKLSAKPAKSPAKAKQKR